MNNIKQEILALVNEVEMGINEYENVNKIIKLLSNAVKNKTVSVDFAKQIDERIGLEYFS